MSQFVYKVYVNDQGRKYLNARWQEPDGKWSYESTKETDQRAALRRCAQIEADLNAGRYERKAPRVTSAARGSHATVGAICDAFEDQKEKEKNGKEIGLRYFLEVAKIIAVMREVFGDDRQVAGLKPEDWGKLRDRLGKGVGKVTLQIRMQRAMSPFLAAKVLVDTGDKFKSPTTRVLRLERAAKGRKDLEADEIADLISKATQPLQAMILLGINCGFGNDDCGTLPFGALDLNGGWVSYLRPKTAASRRCKLWPETVASLKAAIAKRPKHKSPDHAALVFITERGTAFSKTDSDKCLGNDPIGLRFHRLMLDRGLERQGLGFYALRRSFRTAADELPDERAIDLIMGHANSENDMGARYTQKIMDARLEAVANHVRTWLMADRDTLCDTLGVYHGDGQKNTSKTG